MTPYLVGGHPPPGVIFFRCNLRPIATREPPGRLAFHSTSGAPAPRAANPPMFSAAKDALTSRAAQAWAGSLLARYGTVHDAKIDSRAKTLEVSCLLEGELTPITIKIAGYTVETEGGKKFLRATGFTCTRPWLQNVLRDFGPRQRIELPAWAATAL